MPTCNGKHPITTLCMDRKCWLGNHNPLLRLQRRFDRQARELTSVRKSLVQRLGRAGVES